MTGKLGSSLLKLALVGLCPAWTDEGVCPYVNQGGKNRAAHPEAAAPPCRPRGVRDREIRPSPLSARLPIRF